METIICFHNPDEENGYLSNWYPAPFSLDGTDYATLEQYMMHRKALLFGDAAAAEAILAAGDPGEAKAIGRAVRNYDEALWNGVRQIVVYRGLLAKFRQNAGLGARLLATGDGILAECAVHDQIWGIGLPMGDERRWDRLAWRGQNLLGFTLMQVRDALARGE